MEHTKEEANLREQLAHTQQLLSEASSRRYRLDRCNEWHLTCAHDVHRRSWTSDQSGSMTTSPLVDISSASVCSQSLISQQSSVSMQHLSTEDIEVQINSDSEIRESRPDSFVSICSDPSLSLDEGFNSLSCAYQL